MQSSASAREGKRFVGIARQIIIPAIVDYSPICAEWVNRPFCASSCTNLRFDICWGTNPISAVRERGYVKRAKQGWIVILRGWPVNDNNNIFSIIEAINITVDTMRVIKLLVSCNRFSSDSVEVFRSPRLIMLQIIFCGKSNRIWINGSW